MIVGVLVLVEVTGGIEGAQPVDAVHLGLVVDDAVARLAVMQEQLLFARRVEPANQRYRRRVSLAAPALRPLALAMQT